MTTEFSDIFRNNREGKIRIASSGLAWQDGAAKETIVTVSNDNVRFGTVTRAARGFQIRLELKKESKKGSSKRERFDGFKSEDVDRLVNLFRSHFSITLERKDMSLRGWNWGKAEMQGQDLSFLVAGRPAFDIPLSTIHNTSINKTEVALEFMQPEAAGGGARRRGGDGDELVEMRLFLPGSASDARRRAKRARRTENGDGAVKAEDASAADSSSDEDEDEADAEGGDDDQTAAQAFHDEVKDKADVGAVAGEALVTFNEVYCATPRGRYDIDLFPTFFRLRSKSYDYKILYTSLLKLFILPRTDDVNVVIVANLDPPIRQGQTRYPYLVMQFARDEEMEAELNVSDADLDDLKARNVVLEKHYEAPAFEVVSIILRQFTGKKPIVPSGSFHSHDDQAAIKCNLKTAEGHLYFLEKYFIFIAKQPVLVPFGEVHQVKFERVSGVMGSSRTFDLRIVLRSGDETVFSGLGKDEHQPIWDYLKDRNISCKNEMHDEMVATQSAITAALKAADDSDDDMSDDDDDAPRRKKGGDDDDSDSEVDEDFKAGSESDVAEEYDENYKSSGSSSESGSDAGGDDSGGEEDEDGADDAMDEDAAAPVAKASAKRPGDATAGGAAKKAKR